MTPWLFWAQLWVSFWSGMLRRPSAQVYNLDDYRNDNEKPPRRAA
jgi:hypothetical protein